MNIPNAGNLALELSEDLKVLKQNDLSEMLVAAVLGGSTGWEIHGRLTQTMPTVQKRIAENFSHLYPKVQEILKSLE